MVHQRNKWIHRWSRIDQFPTLDSPWSQWSIRPQLLTLNGTWITHFSKNFGTALFFVELHVSDLFVQSKQVNQRLMCAWLELGMRMELSGKGFILIVLLVFVHDAVCRHFRGGTFTYKPVNPSDPENTKVSHFGKCKRLWIMHKGYKSNNIYFRAYSFSLKPELTFVMLLAHYQSVRLMPALGFCSLGIGTKNKQTTELFLCLLYSVSPRSWVRKSQRVKDAEAMLIWLIDFFILIH